MQLAITRYAQTNIWFVHCYLFNKWNELVSSYFHLHGTNKKTFYCTYGNLNNNYLHFKEYIFAVSTKHVQANFLSWWRTVHQVIHWHLDQDTALASLLCYIPSLRSAPKGPKLQKKSIKLIKSLELVIFNKTLLMERDLMSVYPVCGITLELK